MGHSTILNEKIQMRDVRIRDGQQHHQWVTEWEKKKSWFYSLFPLNYYFFHHQACICWLFLLLTPLLLIVFWVETFHSASIEISISLSLSLTHQGTLIKGGEEKMPKIEALEIFCYIIRERALWVKKEALKDGKLMSLREILLLFCQNLFN